MKVVIDATNEKVGRIATKAATILMGKDSVRFRRDRMDGERSVEIVNAAKCSITSKKRSTLFHVRYSGYPGGLRRIPLSRTIEKKGYKEVIQRAVKGMLPRNTLGRKMLMRLEVKE